MSASAAIRKPTLPSGSDQVRPALTLNASTLPLDEIQNFNQRSRDRWVREKAATVAPGLRVLDVGAGTCPYRPLFAHCEYRTHDFKKYKGIKLGNTTEYGAIDYESEITKIPVPDQSFDVILCTEVLEHVPEPIEAVREMMRILKPGGYLFLTAPLGSGLHQLPFHFYGGYTPEWYRYVAQKFGFEINEISPNGGYFKLLAQECGRLSWTMDDHRDLHGPNAELMGKLFGEWLPRYLFGLEERKCIEQFTVGYHVAMTKNISPGQAPSIQAPEPKTQKNKDKVVVKLQGGLGNQMFQYAAGLALARRTGSQLVLDLSFLLDRSPRPDFVYRDFDLPVFKLTPDCQVVRDGSAYAKQLRHVTEKHFHFNPEILSLGANVYLDGYWQSPRYFENILDEVRQSFQFVSEMGLEAQKVLAAIQNCEAVCLNVRRADFVSNPRTRSVHGYCGEAYFQSASRRIAAKIKSPHFFIFSDDIEWCRSANLTGGLPCTFVTHDLAGPRFATYLQLMKSCKHFILPNSTFGWWAAFLSEAQNKTVIVPKPWFNDPKVNTSDLIPAGWETLDKDGQPNKSSAAVNSLVSVIIPCYHQAHYLAEAVESVVNQTFADWEIIVVNDGSPDDTKGAFQQLVNRWPKHVLRYLEKPNGGLADARNAGIAVARGKYILPLDADDKLHPEMLARTVALLEAQPDISIAYTDVVHFGAANGVVRAAEFDFAKLCQNNQLNYCSLYHRELWTAVGGYRTNMLWQGYEDWDFWVGCGERGFKAKRIPEPLLFYRVKNSSMYTTAVQHDRELRAEIVLNHPGAYSPETIVGAMALLGSMELKPKAPAQIFPSKRWITFPESKLAHQYLDGLNGLEIGGSSHNQFGLNTKNVDYTANLTTVHKIEEIKMCGRALKVDIVAPGDALPMADASQDFVISSHVIEHFFDPIKAIKEWMRVVRPGGYIFIIAPHKERTFDKDRPRTALTELLDRHTGKIPPPAVDTHHHYTIWKTEDLLELCRHLEFNVIASQDVDDKVGNGFTVVIQKAPAPVTDARRIEPVTPLDTANPEPSGNAQAIAPALPEPPLVSVIITTFNRPELLVEAVQSVLNQTFANFEVIVINDAGRDVEATLAQLNSQKIVYLRHETNQGLPAARNTGMRAARGKYIAYLDDDDVYYPEHLQTLVDYLAAHPETVAYTNASCSQQDLVNGQWKVQKRDVPYSHDWSNDRVLVENFVPVLCFMHEKACLEKSGYFDETLKRHEDWDLWIRMSRHYAFTHIPQVTCEFVRRNDASSMTSQNLAPFLETMQYVYHKHAGLVAGRSDLQVSQKVALDDLRQLVQTQFNRPKFSIGFLSLDPKNTACAYLRLTAPLNRLHDCHDIANLQVCDFINGRLQINQQLLAMSRIVVVQRGLAAHLPYQDLRKAFPNPAVKIVFELDDALTMLPANHAGYQYFQAGKPRLEEYLKNADLVTVTTPKLKEFYSHFNENIEVLPNSVDTRVWLPAEPRRSANGKISILFSGTTTHEHDLALVEGVIARLIREFPERVEFLFWGNAPASLKGLPQVKIVSAYLPDYMAYARQLKSLPVDLALVPLELTPFNRAKSAIKWLEYSACKIPGIFTDIEAYNQVVEHGKTGWLVPNTLEAWYDAIKKFIQDDGLRSSIAENAYQTVLARHTLNQNVKLWLQAYERVLTRPPRKTIPQTPQVSIIIPTFNNLALTRQCIDAIVGNTPQGLYEIVVVDNGSTDGTPAWLQQEEKAGRLRALLRPQNHGFANGCNFGAQAATSPFLVFLNNDTVVQSGWLTALLSAVARPQTGVVGAKLLYANGTIQHAGIEFINGVPDHPHRHAPADLPAANESRDLDMVTGACLMTPRDVFLKLGGFDEVFRNGVEDVDYCLRVRALNRKVVYEPQSVVYHLEGQSAGRFDHVNENLKIFFARWKGGFDKNYRFIVPSNPKAIPAAQSLLLNATPVGPSNPVKAITVSWEGSFLDYGSLSQVNRELIAALKSDSNLDVHCVAPGVPIGAAQEKIWSGLEGKISTEPVSGAALTVRHAWPPNWRRPGTGKLAVIQPWEFGSLPQEWVKNAADVDEFWVPSNYVRDVYVSSGVPAHKVVVVPNGVDAEKFHPQVPRMKLATGKKFKFLFVGGTIGRKGPDLLLQAYLRNFSSADDVCLVIKDFGGKNVYAGQTFETQIAAAKSIANAPEILYLNDELTPDALPGLYTACDCLVLPYRGEGFGLPVLEAMACGLPVIVTAGGATDDFVRDEFVWRVPAARKVFGREVSGMKLVGDGWLLEPDLAALGKAMTDAYTYPDKSRERGRLASRHARENWSWKKGAGIVAQRIRKLTAQNPKPVVNGKPIAHELPAVARVGQLNEARDLLSRKKLEAAWNATIAAIAKRPFHPEAFLLLAEIAAAAGDANGARQCAQQARELAPEWNAAKQFLKKNLKGGAKLEWLKLPDAIQNQKTGNPRLSICLIVKNEEKFLPQCLKSVRGLAQQLIVVDTGSTDRTVEIAKEFGAEIHAHQWNDDFAAARNTALEHATGDWILILDADEEIPTGQHAKLLADMKSDRVLACRLPLINSGQEKEGRSFVPRLFRNAPGAYFAGRIHEQVFPSLLPFCKSWGLKTAMGTAEMLHHGYHKETMHDRNKIERNLKLLRQACEENPGDVNLTMNLGLELVRSGDVPAGLAKYREAFQAMSELPADSVAPELREVLLTQFTSQLYKIHRHDEVIEILNSPLAKNGGLTASLHLALGLSLFELKNYPEAAEQIRHCLAKRHQPALSPVNTDILTSMPNHCLALALAKTSNLAGAEEAFQAALAENGHTEAVKLDYARFLAGTNRSVDALHKMHELVAANCHNPMLWRAGAEIALGQADFLKFARDWTGEAMRYVPEDSVVMAQRAEVLMLSGDTAAAAELWERIWNADRHAKALAALILCQAIESQTTHAPEDGQEGMVSHAFIAWYQRLIAMRAKTVIVRLNEQMEKLSRALPTAAGKIESALAGARKQEAVVS